MFRYSLLYFQQFNVTFFFIMFSFSIFSELQGEDVDTAAEFAALEKRFADKKAVSFD